MKECLFIFDSVLNENDICNYTKLRKSLISDLKEGKKVVLYGLRNTGKTSLVKSAVKPALRKAGFLVIYADFFGVRTLEQISERLHNAIQVSLLEDFPFKTKFGAFLKSLKTLRPVLKTDPMDGVSLSLEFPGKSNGSLQQIFQMLQEIHKKHPVILAFDEFQDIHYVKQAEALFRSELQLLHSRLGVIFLGSKKHMLAKIFGDPKAPLAGVGVDYDIAPIDFEEYHKYILERFKTHHLKMDLEESIFLQEALLRIPEAINIVCDYISRNYNNTKVTQDIIVEAIQKVTDSKQSRYEEWLSFMTPNEQKVLAAIAKNGPVKTPSGTKFLAQVRISQKGMSNIIKKMNDEALIYHTNSGYIIPDPLLSSYLRRHRI